MRVGVVGPEEVGEDDCGARSKRTRVRDWGGGWEVARRWRPGRDFPLVPLDETGGEAARGVSRPIGSR